MTTSLRPELRSEELRQLLTRIYQKGATGFVSITVQDGARPVYGTLQVSEGQLLSAQFKNLTGRSALEQISSLEFPSISFARSNVTSPRDADIPDMTDVIDLSQVPAARVRTKAKTEAKTKAKTATSEASKTALFGIFGRVLATMLLIAMIPIAAFWAVNSLSTQKQLEASAITTLEEKATSLNDKVETWIESSVAFLDQAAALPTVKSMQTEQQKPVVDALAQTYDVFLASIVGMDGYQSARSDDSELSDADGNKTKFRGDRGYFTQITDSDSTGQQLLIGRTSGKPSLALSRPITSTSGNVIGVIASTIKLDNISNDVTDIRVGETGFAMLVGPKGELIAHGAPGTVPDEFSEWINVGDHPALAIPAGNSVVYEENGVKKVAHTEDTVFGWTLVIMQDYAEAYAAVLTSRRTFTVLLVVAALLALSAAYLLARWLARPIQNLTEVAEAISLGNLGVDIEGKDRSDELGSLARAIERLRVSVKVMFTELRNQQGS